MSKKTLLMADTHLQPYRESNESLSLWEKEAQQYALDKIINIIKKRGITKIVHLGDFLENSFPKDFELKIVDYFFSNIPKGVEFTIISGNHELNRDSTKRIYYWEFMKEFYKEKYGIIVYDYDEIGQDLYCGHGHISKLETLTKKYRYIFSHIRSSDGTNKFITDEIVMASLKVNAEKVFIGDIHQNLEYDNIKYVGQSTWTNFLNIKYEEDFDKYVTSVIILDEDSGEYERVALFEKNSPYQKKL
jgi:predicted phosphodiesterase